MEGGGVKIFGKRGLSLIIHKVVRRAIDNQWAVTDPNLPSWKRGGSNAYEQLQLLTSYGLRADLLAGYNETGIANLVRSGRGVIIAVARLESRR
jgi:hypothetical protein